MTVTIGIQWLILAGLFCVLLGWIVCALMVMAADPEHRND